MEKLYHKKSLQMNKKATFTKFGIVLVVAVVLAIVVFMYEQYRIKDIETSYQSDARFVWWKMKFLCQKISSVFYIIFTNGFY